MENSKTNFSRITTIFVVSICLFACSTSPSSKLHEFGPWWKTNENCGRYMYLYNEPKIKIDAKTKKRMLLSLEANPIRLGENGELVVKTYDVYAYEGNEGQKILDLYQRRFFDAKFIAILGSDGQLLDNFGCSQFR